MMSEFDPSHHALLFAWIAQEAIRRVGAGRGQAAVRAAVRQYGEQRGRRMAQRAQSDGRPPDMTSYLAYGEWRAASEAFETARDATGEAPRTLVLRCPWHQAWVEEGINQAGRLYCLEIDVALARGFSPALRLEVNGTRSNGAEACQFIYHGADLEALNEIQVDPSQTVKPWAYHLGHLFKTMRLALSAELGAEGEAAAEAGLEAFARRFGRAAADQVRSYLETDFDSSEGN
jgi:hypothetical protein